MLGLRFQSQKWNCPGPVNKFHPQGPAGHGDQLKDWAQALGQHNQIESEQTQGLCLWPPEEAFIPFLLVVEMRGYEQVSTGAIGQNLLLGWKDCGIWSQELDTLELFEPLDHIVPEAVNARLFNYKASKFLFFFSFW